MNNHFQPSAKPYLMTKSLHPENQVFNQKSLFGIGKAMAIMQSTR